MRELNFQKMPCHITDEVVANPWDEEPEANYYNSEEYWADVDSDL